MGSAALHVPQIAAGKAPRVPAKPGAATGISFVTRIVTGGRVGGAPDPRQDLIAIAPAIQAGLGGYGVVPGKLQSGLGFKVDPC